jgi:putative phage-type endonuclease
MTHPPEWHDARKLGIGGSDWQHVLNLEPYGCARSLWYEKTGVEPDVEPEETGPMRRGKMLEPLVADEVAAAMGRKIRRPSRLKNSAPAPWWIGNIDRMIVGKDGSGPGVLECKTTHPNTFYKLKKGEWPEQWIAQVNHYLGLTGWTWGVIGVLNPVSWELITLWIDRDEELLAAMLAAGDRFWRMVENGPTPDRIEPADRRCQSCPWRITCQGSAIFDPVNQGDGEVEEISDPALEDLVRRREEIRAVSDDARGMLSAVNAEIREHLGGFRKVLSGNVRVYFTESMSSRVDLDALRQAHPDIVSKFTLPKRSTRLTVYT